MARTLLATALSLSLAAASAKAQTEAPTPDQSLTPAASALSLTPIRPEIAAAPTQNESKKPGLAQALAQNAPARSDVNIKSLNQPQSINAGSISGQVTSMDGTRTVPGASVVLTHNTQDHKRFETESDDKGNFHFNNIEPGGWTITTSAKEMLSHSQTTQVIAGETTNVPVKLDDIEPVDVLRITGNVLSFTRRTSPPAPTSITASCRNTAPATTSGN
ncbi:MAG: carboxypeptidase regulatory-like domain-containing protein [Candidatus Competibacteraceae bacterium]|nr:carboxypeptidase regulatory-like domain-containing protein [Candidatus Competibacteraceae bacterium]